MKNFQTISEASRSTGLSMYWLRRSCRDGSIPHIMSGRKFLINVPELLRQLGAEGNSRSEEAADDQ